MHSPIYYILPLILWNCAPQRPDPKNDNHDGSTPVLILDNEHISLNEFDRRIETLPAFARSTLSTIEAKRAHLSGVAKFEVLAKYAVKIGLAKDPKVVSALKIALQKSKHKKGFEITPLAIDNEIERNRREIRYGLIVEDTDCSLNDLSTLDASKRIAAIQDRIGSLKGASGVRSFSTRVRESALSQEQATLMALPDIGVHKIWREQGDRCTIVVLTKIEKIHADRLKIETDLRAKKIKAFVNTLEK